MQIFDRINPLNLNRRQYEVLVLVVCVILILAGGMTFLMHPTVFSNSFILSGATKRRLFFGFGTLSVPLMGYLLGRQIVINRLRRRVAKKHQQAVEIRPATRTGRLETLPGFDFFRDLLAMEYHRAARTRLPLSLLLVPLTPSPQLPDKDEIDTVFGDAAKALTRKLRAKDSIYHFPPGVFAIFLPGVGTEIAFRILRRLTEGLQDASAASTRFLFEVHLINYPEHASTAREIEEAARCLFPAECLKAQKVEAA
jgi:GGDEF domain-containing protein